MKTKEVDISWNRFRCLYCKIEWLSDDISSDCPLCSMDGDVLILKKESGEVKEKS